MANGVYHTGLGIELNLTEPDLGHPEYPGLWDLLHADTRPVPQRQLQCLQCRETRPSCPEWMFLTERDGARFASHFTRGIADHPTNESDEHKAYKERVAHAAEEAGFTVAVEDKSVDGRRRTDVLVRGHQQIEIGWEIQLGWVSLESVRKRVGFARRDGITPLWAASDGTREFIDRVPWALVPDFPWHRIKDDRDLMVRGGVRQLSLYRCDFTRPQPCPVKGRGRCGRLHGEWISASGILLDDLVQGSAAGEYVPIILPGKRVRRWWVTPDDRDRFADSVGGLPTEDDLVRHKIPKIAVEAVPRPVDPECRYGQESGYRSPPAVEQDDGSSVPTTATFPLPLPEPPPRTSFPRGSCNALADRNNPTEPCGQTAKFYPCGWRCHAHRPLPAQRRPGGGAV